MLNSLTVIRRNPLLLLFPVTTAALTVVMAGLFLTPIALAPTGHHYTEAAHWEAVGQRYFVVGPADALDAARGRKETVTATPAAAGLFAVFYLLSMFLATFFNVAFMHEIFNALDDKPVSIGEGFRFALTKLKPILAWSLFAGLVGLLIKSLERRFGFFGNMIVRLIGTAWSVASVFVIPVLVLEEHPDNPIGVVKQSAAVIRKTWGEALAGYAGLQIGGTIVGLSSLLAFGFALFAGFYLNSVALAVGSVVMWLLFACAFSYLMSVAGQVYLCVLYRYASAGTVAPGYSPEMLTAAWRPKKS